MSTHCRVTVTGDPFDVEKAKNQDINLSKVFREALKKELDVSQLDNPDIIRDEIKGIQEELEELREEKEALEKRISDKETELSTAKASLEKLEREEDEKDGHVGRFKEIFDKQTADNRSGAGQYQTEDKGAPWQEPEDIPDFWTEKTGKTREELWEIGEEA